MSATLTSPGARVSALLRVCLPTCAHVRVLMRVCLCVRIVMITRRYAFIHMRVRCVVASIPLARMGTLLSPSIECNRPPYVACCLPGTPLLAEIASPFFYILFLCRVSVFVSRLD